MIRNDTTKGRKTMKLSDTIRAKGLVGEHAAARVAGTPNDWAIPIRIETTTDGYYLISNSRQLQIYLNTFGDVEVEYDSQYKVYRVPAFKAKIEKFTAAKAANCKIWGCE